MKKIIGFVFVLVSLIASWYLFNKPANIDTQTHAAIQSQLAILIEETIKAKKPQSSHFALNHLSTNSLNEGLISAQFSYKFDDELPANGEESKDSVTQTISGNALLAKVPSEDGQVQKWVIQSIKTNQESVSFDQGLVITADDNKKTE